MYYYQFHIGDFRGDTLHLSNSEELAYRRLLDWYYDTEKPIPLDTQWVSRRLRVDMEDVVSVLEDFFQRTESGWVSSRCQREIDGYHGLVEKNRENGKKGGRPKKDKNPVGSESDTSGNPVESQKKPNHEPLTNNHKPKKKPSPSAHADDGGSFDSFWKLYPKKVSRKDAAKAWAKIPADKHQQVMVGLARHRVCDQWLKDEGKFIPNAATWLNAERWEDEVKQYAQRTEANRTVSVVDRVKSRAAERERARQGAVPQYAEQGDFIEGEFIPG